MQLKCLGQKLIKETSCGKKIVSVSLPCGLVGKATKGCMVLRIAWDFCVGALPWRESTPVLPSSGCPKTSASSVKPTVSSSIHCFNQEALLSWGLTCHYLLSTYWARPRREPQTCHLYSHCRPAFPSTEQTLNKYLEDPQTNRLFGVTAGCCIEL